jgi:hypothetical protein
MKKLHAVGKIMALVGVLTIALGLFAGCSIESRTAQAVAEVENSSVVRIKITDGGRGYTLCPQVFLKGGGGTGAVAEVFEYLSGSVGRIEIRSGGSGYTSAPEVGIESPQQATFRSAGKSGKETMGKIANWFSQSKRTIGLVAVIAVLAGVIVAFSFSARRYSRKIDTGRFAKYNFRFKVGYVIAGVVVIALTFATFALKELKIGPWAERSRSDEPKKALTPVDPSPVGTWIDGDTSTVYNRLTVSSSGFYKFETVDFTGDVKGGHSGRWRLNGSSVHYIYDGGEITGSKVGQNGLSYGATTFYRR